MSHCISAEGVSKKFGDVEALRGVDLTVDEGVFGLVGPNGSGKTTLIKILIGALKADSGEARVFGFNCWDETLDVKRRVGVLHERASFPKEATGFDFLVLVGRLRGLGKTVAKTTAFELLDRIGLNEVSRRRISGYSAGMKQKLNFIQALVGRPSLVILDEPTAHLDPSARMQLSEKVKELRKEHGISFLISSHILPELEELCDNIGIIYQGVLVEQGTLHDFAKKYFANTFELVTRDLEAVLGKVRGLRTVKEAHIVDGVLVVRVSDPKEFYDSIARLADERKGEIRITQRVGDRLKEVYRAVLHSKEG